MNGTLAQTIAIATHGTAWLRDRGSVDLDAFVADNSTFQFVGRLEFEGAGGLPAWLEARADEGVERLWFAPGEPAPEDGALAPHLAAAFAGGGSGAILAVGREASALWRGAWTVVDRDAPDRRIWGVSYESRPTDLTPTTVGVTEAAERLAAALTAARAFATRMEMDHWAQWFADALRAWDDPDATPKFHPDLFPPGHVDERALRLAAMAQGADVFGGMGSWNDYGFQGEDGRTYEAVSVTLYAAMLDGLAAAVNADLVA